MTDKERETMTKYVKTLSRMIVKLDKYQDKFLNDWDWMHTILEVDLQDVVEHLEAGRNFLEGILEKKPSLDL